MVGEGLAPPVLPEFRALREYSHALRLVSKLPDLRAANSARNLPAKAHRAHPDEGVAPPKNEKSNPCGLLRSLARVDKKDASRILLFNFKIQIISANGYKQCSVRAKISLSL